MNVGVAFVIVLLIWLSAYLLHTKLGNKRKSPVKLIENSSSPKSIATAATVFFYVTQIVGVLLLYTHYVSKWVTKPGAEHLVAVGAICLSIVLIHLAFVRRAL